MKRITITLHLTHDDEDDFLSTEQQARDIVAFFCSEGGLGDEAWFPNITVNNIETKIEE